MDCPRRREALRIRFHVVKASLQALLFCLVFVLMAPLVALAANCSHTSTGLTPILDLGSNEYEGVVGGLYPDGANDPPEAHLDLGLSLAAEVVPRDAAGITDPAGSIGLISIGVSNTKSEFAEFVALAAASEEMSPAVILVNGAQGSRPLEEWSVSASGTPWQSLQGEVAKAGLSPAQVQVAWIMLPPQTRGTLSLAAVDGEAAELAEVVRFAKLTYPNLGLAFVSSREYAGYANSDRAEPAAYINGFVAKQLIEQQIAGEAQLNADALQGPVVAPWLAWGPYLWADGIIPRSDGLTWDCEDFSPDDGIHPAEGAAFKVGTMLLNHFLTSPTTKIWFAAQNPPSVTTLATTSLATSSPPTSKATISTSTSPIESGGDSQTSVWPVAVLVGIGAVVAGAAAGIRRRRRR